MIRTGGEEVGGKAVAMFVEIDGSVGGGMTSMVRQEFLDDVFRGGLI